MCFLLRDAWRRLPRLAILKESDAWRGANDLDVSLFPSREVVKRAAEKLLKFANSGEAKDQITKG